MPGKVDPIGAWIEASCHFRSDRFSGGAMLCTMGVQNQFASGASEHTDKRLERCRPFSSCDSSRHRSNQARGCVPQNRCLRYNKFWQVPTPATCRIVAPGRSKTRSKTPSRLPTDPESEQLYGADNLKPNPSSDRQADHKACALLSETESPTVGGPSVYRDVM